MILARMFPGTLDYWLTTDDDRMIATALDLVLNDERDEAP